MKKEYCLVLEGGGVKCAYQNGVLKALEKAGYKFNAVAGTSFGALNGAMYVEGKNARLDEFWSTLSPNEIFNDDHISEVMNDIYHREVKINEENIAFAKEGLGKLNTLYDQISNGYHQTVQKNVNEDKIRASKVDFCVVTCKVPSTASLIVKGIKTILNPVKTIMGMLKPEYDESFVDKLDLEVVEISKNEIEDGLLPKYVDASAATAPFRLVEINGDHYYDGGVRENCPIPMMKKRGYKKILAIRTNMGDLSENTEEVLVKCIAPSESLGGCALFATDKIADLRKQGLEDGIKFVDNEMPKSLIWKIRRKKLLKNI